MTRLTVRLSGPYCVSRLAAVCAGWLVWHASGGIAMGQAAHNPLERFRWQDRVVVMSASTPDDVALVAQQTRLRQAANGLRERELVVIAASDAAVVVDGIESGDLAPEQLRLALALPPGAFQVLLVGKDGGVKLRSNELVAVDELFSLIDAMPMRRREMRERGGEKP